MVKIFYSSKFAREYRKLPLSAKKTAEKKEKIFRENPFDSKLKTHKLKGGLRDFWSFSIDRKYRIIFEFATEEKVWFHSVGAHDIYGLWE
ncbi:MAG: type II toxin-antitoxin system mRNA interferase toxin, RelE/StbE family [Parcubacteria group bacterium CG08_land_8_20_14_0_20_43_9]|nr:MAG: type II toxin-antitoxin system mRNA interferase toxin, RelE/StbE family [Parcubacteria group bacterium CG08_land_8_20_14_0_20_43_9]